MRVAVLCGGFGAARFLDGLRRVPGLALTCVVNTADDVHYAGVHVSPDVDTVTYALAGLFDEGRGFGMVGDTFRNAEALRRYGSGWFAVGDTDLATSLRRTERLRAGASLSEATAELAAVLGLEAAVVPMSDDAVRTVVVTDEGRLPFQEWLVARRAQPAVRAVEYEGLAGARPAPAVLPALQDADLVILAPSSPVASLAPILALPGVRPALPAGAVTAVTPVVSGRPPATPPERSRARVRAAFMAAAGLAHSATAVAGLYAGLADTFVLDERDAAAEAAAVRSLGLEVVVADTLAAGAARVTLADAVLATARPPTAR
ncbi:MAG TPA: 2-phospho-L-lactate transferase CofD family protein [Acidimicrobiia bacterium]|nr:2-phospho-L-lactate transferase CofD family protein [Acidimicrobiia bacterium]